MKRLLPLFVAVLAACGRIDTAPQPIEIPPPAQCPAVERIRPVRIVNTPPAQQPDPLQPGELRRVLRDTTTNIALELTSDTVFCSELGYGASFLKVSVPDLDWLAHFDHRVSELGLPCAAAGACTETNNPAAVLAGNPRLSVVPVHVVLTEVMTIDPSAGTCTRQLVETVTVQLADRMLQHSAESGPEAYPFEKCVAVSQR